MNNTPDDSAPQSGDGQQPGQSGQPYGPAQPGQPYGPAQPGQPYGAPQPAQPYGPAQPGQPYDPNAPQPKRPLSFGAGLGIGVGIGCGAQALGLVLFFMLIFSGIGLVSWLVSALILIGAIVMMFFPKTRSFATGILIVSAAVWIVFLGPCLAMVGGGF